MEVESTVHYGDYGCAQTLEKKLRESEQRKNFGKWHASLSSDEITKWFIAWGIIGKLQPINPVIRLMPYFDRGPGPS